MRLKKERLTKRMEMTGSCKKKEGISALCFPQPKMQKLSITRSLGREGTLQC